MKTMQSCAVVLRFANFFFFFHFFWHSDHPEFIIILLLAALLVTQRDYVIEVTVCHQNYKTVEASQSPLLLPGVASEKQTFVPL